MPSANTMDHAEENAEAQVLLSQAEKHRDLGKKITANVRRIEESTACLKELVGPVYNDTQELQTYNSSKCLLTITIFAQALTSSQTSTRCCKPLTRPELRSKGKLTKNASFVAGMST